MDEPPHRARSGGEKQLERIDQRQCCQRARFATLHKRHVRSFSISSVTADDVAFDKRSPWPRRVA